MTVSEIVNALKRHERPAGLNMHLRVVDQWGDDVLSVEPVVYPNTGELVIMLQGAPPKRQEPNWDSE